jgi:magnesium chelatase subunit D
VSRLAFSAVVGQDEAKLALLLAAREPRLGGVLLRGDKGSAKTTQARSLASLLPGAAPFVELPLGATEDRVVGSIDLASLLRGDDPVVRPGLLAAAHGGVLYVDEVNLLADHLVDVLLDVAVSGVNRIERDGVTHQHPARFVLIGSMNPEEGELRPQLLDRFGLAVEVRASADRSDRAEAVRRQLAAEAAADDRPLASGLGDPAAPSPLAVHDAADDDLRARLAHPHRATVPDDVIELASALALEVGAEGLRADLMLSRAAAAHASWRGADAATADDVRVVAPLVLGHRRRRSPLEPPGLAPQDLDDAFDRAEDAVADEPGEPDDTDRPDDGGDGDTGDGSPPEGGTSAPAPSAAAMAVPELRRVDGRDRKAGRRSEGGGERGRYVRAERVDPGEPVGSLAVTATAVSVAERRQAEARDGAGGSAGGVVQPGDLRRAVKVQRTGNLVVLCVDVSGSMGADRRLELAKGAALGLLTDAYQRRDRVALVTFGGGGATVVLRPTASVEIAKARLADIPVGGPSPIAEGLDAVHRLVTAPDGGPRTDPLVVLLTDGRATGSDDAVPASRAAAVRLAGAGVASVVVDAETGPTRLGLAAELAEALGAPCLHLDDLVDGSLERTIRLRLRP